MVHDKESSIQAARRLVARQEEEEGGGGDDGTGYTDPSWVEDDDDGNYSDPTYSDDGTQQQQQQVDATDTAYDDGSADPTYSDGTEQPTDTYYDDGGYYPTSTYLDGSEATDTAYDSYTATSTDYYDTETATATDYNPTPTDQQEISTTDAATPTDTDIANTESSYYSPITYTTQPATSVPEDVYTTTLYQDTLTAAATTTDAIAATPTPETTTSTQDDNPATSSDSPPTTLSSSASSAASPSIVLGTNECASDPSAVNGKCPSDSYCNAATSQCMKLLDNRSQCFEDFQCVSGHCNNNQCGDATDKSGPASLSGGQLAGITVGSVAGAVILFVLGAWLLKRKTRQVSQRARKFEQVRIEDDDLERSDYMFNGTGSSPTMLDEKAARRTSKFNLLAAMLTGGTAVARSFSRLGSSTNSNRQQPAVDRSSYTPSDFKQQDPLPEMQSINNVPPAGLRARESKIADLSNMQHEHDIQQKHQAASPALTDTQPEQMTGEHHKVTTAATGAIAGAAVATGTVRNKDMQQENPYDDHTYYAQTLEPLTPMPAAHLDNNAMSNTDSYRNNAHQSWMSTASAIDPIGASGSTKNRDTIVADRPNTMALRESTFNNLHASIFRLDGNREEMPNIVSSPIQSPASATSARNSWLLKEIASRWRQGSTSGALQEPSSSMEEGDNHNNNRRSSLLLGRSSELWDDALVSTANSVAERLMSYAETSTTITTSTATVTTHNPFRDSSHNPRDSLTLGNVMNAPLPPHIEQDAWSSEDHVSLSSNPRSTAAAYVNNNNNNGK